MNTMTHSATHPATHPATRSAVRLTRRGRAVLLSALLALVAVAMVALSSLASASGDSAPATEVRYVRVAPGDTLYDLAADVAAPGEIRAMVEQIKDLNAMTASSLRAGDRVAVPLG